MIVVVPGAIREWRLGGSGHGTSVTEKALPSGSQNENMAGTPGPAEDFIGVHASGRERGVGVAGVVGGEPDADGAAGDVRCCRSRVMMTLGLPGASSMKAAGGRRGVAQCGEAERAGIEAQGVVLVLDRDADGAHAGDVGLGRAHLVLLAVG
jgi:hypothetical protein